MDSIKTKITVVVPFYNEEKHLERCIDSILCQSYSDFSLILVDDGSSDGSAQICKKYEEKDSRIKYVYKDNGGISSARNAGLSYVNTEFVTFIDSDDWVENNHLEELMNGYTPDLQLSICAYCRDDGENVKKFHCDEFVSNDKTTIILNMMDALKYNSGPCNKVYRTKILKENDIKFDERYTVGEDLLFNMNYMKFCDRCKYSAKTFYHYMTNPNSMMNSMKHYKTFNVKWLTEWDTIRECEIILRDNNAVMPAVNERKFTTAIKIIEIMNRCKYENKDYSREMTRFISKNMKMFFKTSYIKISKKRRLRGFFVYLKFRLKRS